MLLQESIHRRGLVTSGNEELVVDYALILSDKQERYSFVLGPSRETLLSTGLSGNLQVPEATLVDSILHSVRYFHHSINWRCLS